MYLKEILKDKKISQRKLGFMTNIAAQDLCAAINNKRSFFPKWRKAVSKALSMSEEELFPEYCDKPQVQEAI